MPKGQLPRAYLRLDPNIDQTHPDCGAFIRLLCAGARQPKRGRFRDRAVLENAIGKRAAKEALARGDVEEVDGRLVIDGWDIWQEGDFTVGERMRRFRARHSDPDERNETVSSGVTDADTKSSPPSEASGVKASGTDPTDYKRQAGGSVDLQTPTLPEPGSDLARYGEPGTAEALRAEIVTLLAEVSALTDTPQDVLLTRCSRAGRSVIVNVASVSSVNWLRTTRDKLIGERLQHAADRQPTGKAKQGLDGIKALIAGGMRDE